MTENNYDIEFISYSGLIINKKIRESVKVFIILSLIFLCLSIVIIVLNCFKYNHKKRIYRFSSIPLITHEYIEEDF